MEATTIIKRPLITEKSTEASDDHNRFSFEVDIRANKMQIRRAIEQLYNVRVQGVATQRRQGRVRRYRYGYVQEPVTKRAIVKIHPEDRIELF